MSAKELVPEDENVGSRHEPSLSTSRKVILPNKANSSASSRNKDTSIPVPIYFRKNAILFVGSGNPAWSRLSRRRGSGQRTHKVILPIKPKFSSSSRNQDTSIRCDDQFSEEPIFPQVSCSARLRPRLPRRAGFRA